MSSLCFGLVALLRLAPALLSLTTLFATYMLIDGTLAIYSAVRAQGRRERWGGLAAEGVINLAVAALVMALPGATVLTFGYIAAVWAMLSGAVLLVASKRLVFGHAITALAAGISILFVLLLATTSGLARSLCLGVRHRPDYSRPRAAPAIRNAADDTEQTAASRSI